MLLYGAYIYYRKINFGTSMLNFLPPDEKNEILKIRGRLEELRVRAGQPISVTYSVDGDRKKKILSKIYSYKEIDEILLKLCDYSIFGRDESIRQGFVTSSEGERVGLCGSVVKDGEKITTIKQITSMCIRLPNDIEGLALPFFRKTGEKTVSTLVISPPAQGKTTFLRDLGRIYSDKSDKNVLFIDERDEFSASGRFYLGKNSDVLKYADKNYGFKNGVRTLNPDIIVCDEIMSENDLSSCALAAASGVATIASVHSDNLKNLLKKPIFSDILGKRIFRYFVELSYGGKIVVYNEKGELC